MPCSSSETGAGSNWESCCTALTAFLSAPAATSSRTEGLLSTGGRSRARAPRVTRPGGGIGAPVLLSAVASSSPTRGNSVLPSTSAGFAAARAFAGGENGGGRVDSEGRRTFSEDAAFALADSAGRMARAGAVARNEDPLSSSPVSLSDAATEECCIARRHDGGRDVEVVRSGGQDESAHREPGAISDNAVLACAASDARPAMETPVTCTGSVNSSAASSAVAVIASVRSTGAASTSTEATSAVSTGCSGVNVASAVSHGSSVVNADVTSGDRGTNITPWRTWRNVRSESVRAPLQIETTHLTRASYASTGGWGPTTLLRSAETGDLLLVRPTSPQLSRQAHMAPPAGRAEPASHEASERNDALERGFPVAQPVDPAAVVSVEAGSIRPSLSGRGARGRAAAHSAPVPGQVCAPRETSGADKGSAADRKPDDYALEGFPSRGTDRGEARVAAGTVGAAAAVDKGAEAPADENAEDAERSDASQVVFYSPERSPPREAEADAPSLLLFGVETRQGKTRPREACLSLSLAAAPQISRVLQKHGSEEAGCSTATSAIKHGHAQLEGTAEELRTSLLSAGVSSQEALHARAGQQDRRSAGQPARTVLPGIISGSGGASPAPPSQSTNVPSMVQDRAGDDTGMLVIRAEGVGVPAKDLQLPRTASRMPSGGLAHVTASESSAARERRGRMHCEPPTERPRRGPTPPGSVALVGGLESEGDSMLQRRLTTRAAASAGKGGAAETGRKGRLMAVGISPGRGKRGGQSTRQRSAQFGGEERSNAGDHLLAGERTQPSRRGRCQRPTSWKRVRQLTGEGQLSFRGSSLFIHAASHAVGRADNMQSEGLKPPQKWCGRQHSLEERAAKPEPTVSGYEKNDGEALACNSIVACPLRSEPSGSQEKHSGRATEIFGGQRESGASPKPVVSHHTALNKEGGRASSCEAGTKCPGTTGRQTSTLVSDQGKEEATLSSTGLCTGDISPVVTALGAEGRSTGAPLKEGAAGLENKECLSGSDLGVPTVVARGMADDDSRKRSIGPGEFASFDEDTSGDEGSVSAGEAGGPAWPHVISSQKPPHSQVRVPRGRGAVSAEAECLPAASLSTCMQALRPRELGCSPEDVDEDEASRFFKRRRCSLLLWGGIRNDRGHSAVQQASLNAPAYSAPTSRDAGGGQEDSADNISGVSTTSVCQVERVKQRQETPGSISAIASHKRCVRGSSEPETTTDERAAEKRRDEGSSGEESAGIPGTGANADLVAPTVRRVSEAAASPLGTPAGFTSRLLRKRKRGVGVCASRLVFLQRPGAGVSSEDAALVNSLSSALTYEETQQLRRLEREHRQLELLRQQEEARRKEQAAAARLREQQKAAAAVIAAAASARTSPPRPFVFGSATAAVAPTSGSDAVAPAALPAQGETHRATTFVEESCSGTAPTRSTRAPSQPKSAAESTSAQTSVPASLSCERHSAAQSTEQQPQTKEPFSSGRPKLRIIRSPAAGDTAVSALPAAGDAGGGLAGPGVGEAAVGSVAHTQSTEGSSGSAASSLQQAELPAAFGGGSSGLPPSRVGGLFGVAQQPPMRTGILPAEFGGAAGATGATGTGVAGSGGFGIASAFGVTSAGPSVSAANPFAFQRGGRGLRKGGSGRRR